MSKFILVILNQYPNITLTHCHRFHLNDMLRNVRMIVNPVIVDSFALLLKLNVGESDFRLSHGFVLICLDC